jgi:hypothetical protein
MKTSSTAFTFFLLVQSFISTTTSGQTINGVVVNAKSGDALPFASIILLSDKKSGTVTNEEGKFTLKLTAGYEDTLAVSYIGYRRKIIPLKNLAANNFVIELHQDEKLLDEVVILAEDTLLRLLTRAFNNIEKNYPSKGTLIKGFYRETNQLLPEKGFIYFSEAVIEFYKPNYHNKHFGPVKIIEGGKAEISSRRNQSGVYFYAGPYVPQRFDFVKNREEFINPADFKKYSYNIESKTTFDSSDVYVIRFKPTFSGSFEGTFVLDVKTLAYIEADYKLTAYGLMKDNLRISQFRFRNRKYTVKYRLIDGRWNIYLAFQDGIGINNRAAQEIRYTNEFISTSFVPTDDNPIKESDAIPFSGVYTNYEKKFSNDFWQKPEIVSRVKDMEQTVHFIFKRGELTAKDTNTLRQKREASLETVSGKKMLLKLLMRLSSGISIGIAPVSSVGGNYNVSYQNAFIHAREIHDAKTIPIIASDVKYYTGSTAIVVKQLINLNKKYTFNFLSIGAEWRKTIVGWRTPLYFQPGINFYYATSMVNLGTTETLADFNIDGKYFNSQKIDLGIGETRFGIMPSVQLVYKTQGRFSIFAEVQSSVYSRSSDKVFIKESDGFLLTRRSAKIKVDSQQLVLQRNGVDSEKTNTYLSDNRIFATIGFRVGMK